MDYGVLQKIFQKMYVVKEWEDNQAFLRLDSHGTEVGD